MRSNMTSGMKKGSEIIIEVLQEEGVDVIFGFPGGQIIPFYDALYQSPIRHILTRHEQGAAHAADSAELDDVRRAGCAGVVCAAGLRQRG